ncbi:DNA primase [Kribbella sp. VKM Ac-2527]|uniref:DNA primase n=1 Tax=Kribbella caucasensis TaxID=2512215 RepID=A0A4R6KJP6_9ACTN|nr:toprim domain-containing protein [Kribbella sp. VKM Ac-2527]TDO51528.1 DNA primase [Kribbella sp. VKM Ac-2527]
MTGHQHLVEANSVAAQFFRQELLKRPDGWAAEHLRERRLEAAVAPDSGWCVGYAPDGWSRLVGHLRRAGFDDRTIVAAGLASPTSNGYLIDRFRDRVTFVAHDIDLKPVGFIGRGRAGRVRYLNTPNTDIYAKGKSLVGLDAQLVRLEAGAVPVVVEGTMDALAVSLAGGEWAGVACCGTAITREQVLILKRHARVDVAIVALDGNLAGRTGAVRSLDVLSSAFGQVLVAEFPDEHDPASLFAAEPGRLRSALSSPRSLIDFAIDVELSRWSRVLDHISGQVNAVRAVAPLVARLPAGRVAGEIARLSRKLGLEEQVVSREVLAVVGLRDEQRATRRRMSYRSADAEAGADPPDLPRTP